MSVLELLVFINQSLYCYASLPQIMLNYYRRSGKALSDSYLAALFHKYTMLIFYFFCMDQAISYRVSASVITLMTIVMIVQRFYYFRGGPRKIMMVYYVINTMLLFFLIPVAYAHPLLVGNTVGWISVFFVVTCRIPQIYHFYQEKSVKGFSSKFLLYWGTASIMEVAISLWFGFPIQTTIMAISNFLAIAVMSIQHEMYKRRPLK